MEAQVSRPFRIDSGDEVFLVNAYLNEDSTVITVDTMDGTQILELDGSTALAFVTAINTLFREVSNGAK